MKQAPDALPSDKCASGPAGKTFECVKVSDLGWLCLWNRGEWLAMFKLTEEQLRDWREVTK